MNQSTIKRKRNPQYLADAIWISFGSSKDSRVGYDGTNDEGTVQSKDAGGTQTDRVRVKANQDITRFELYNDDPGATAVQLDVHHDSASPAASDTLFHLRVYGEDDASAKTQYAGFKVTLDDPTDTSEDATVGVEMVTAGTLRTASFPNITADDTVAVLALAQTLSNKTLTSPVLTAPQINDTSADHQYIFAVSELAADRTVTLPLLTGNATFSFIDFAETISAVKTHSANVILNDSVNLGLGTSSGEGTISSDGTSIKIGSVAGKDIILGDDAEVMRVSSGDAVIFGSGEGGTTAATGKTIRAPDITTGGAGNIAGADLTIAAGRGTGTGDVGQIIFQAARVAAAGDNIQTLNTALVVDDDGTDPLLVPGADNTVNIGTASLRFKLVRAVTITSGDFGWEERYDYFNPAISFRSDDSLVMAVKHIGDETLTVPTLLSTALEREPMFSTLQGRITAVEEAQQVIDNGWLQDQVKEALQDGEFRDWLKAELSP